MEPKMLKSQFETLEEPENAIDIDISDSPEEIIQEIKSHLKMKTEIGVIGMGVMGEKA